MKGLLRRGTMFIVMLALLLGMMPGALAQEIDAEVNTEVELESENQSAVPEAEEELEEPSEGTDKIEKPGEGGVSGENSGEITGEEPPEEEPMLTQVGTFSEGMIRVTDGTHWGYASPDGTVVIPVQFDAAEDFVLGAAPVTVDGMVGLLHWSGSYLFAPEYDTLSAVGYGLYLGRRGEQWDLLSTAPVSAEVGTTCVLYSGLEEAQVVEGVNGQLILRETDGKTTRVLLRNLPQWLKSKKVNGWQFPLYTGGRADFADVSGQEWYDRWVNLAYSIGMMEGTGNRKFEPEKELTVAETLRLAACLESRAIQDDFHLQGVSGNLWYSSSVTYCETVGIIAYGEYGKDDFERPVTRAEMARIFSRTTAVRSMGAINDPERVRSSVPDVMEGDYAAEAIYDLFAKGVFTGKDSACSFHPTENLTRAEAATMIVRITRPEHRIKLWE